MSKPNTTKANPQALAAVSKRIPFDKHPDLATEVDADTWLTPRYILSQLGGFDLDPCAAETAAGWTNTGRVFTKADDGLRQPWIGRVFMNPPFSNTVPWLLKHSLHGLGISLVPTTTESCLWRDVVWKKARGVLLLHGRTRFCGPDGSATLGRPLRGVALIGWSCADAEVLQKSSLAGVFIDHWNQR